MKRGRSTKNKKEKQGFERPSCNWGLPKKKNPQKKKKKTRQLSVFCKKMSTFIDTLDKSTFVGKGRLIHTLDKQNLG